MAAYPPLWGPHLWTFLHIWSTSYPLDPGPEDRSNALAFLESTIAILPCRVCRFHSKQYFRSHHPALGSRDELVLWLVQFHNHVNVQTDKAPMALSDALSLVRDLSGLEAGRSAQSSNWRSIHLSERLLEREKSVRFWKCLFFMSVVFTVSMEIWRGQKKIGDES